MRITFLGGGESIGASCAVLDIDERRWVIDCGIRLRGTGAEQLPDLSRLEDGPAPTAIFISHAHLDHVGALPVLYTRYPLAHVYATPPTIALTRIQLLDSLRIMEQEASREGELPLYSARTVESLLERMIPVTPLRTFQPDDGGPEVTFFPAGHILGACSLGISGREGRVFISGDVSVDNQRTIPGMNMPRFRADVAVFESTYGKRLHPDRSAEESRLVETVASTVASGGKVLIPAFAIGRAQEVILVLLRAQLQGRIEKFPVYVDGMVRAVCAAYSSFPKFLQSTLRRRIEKHGDPFFGVLDNVVAVRQPAQRQEILSGPPCAIVSSSGMLSGGPSPVYARALIEDPANLIALTGYQDEESPGRRLLDCAAGRTESLPIEGVEVRPRAKVTSYALSGHASGVQIASLLRALKPRDIFLVHGDAGARHDLADLLIRERIGRVHLPAEGKPEEPGSWRSSGAAGASPKARPDGLRRLKATGISAGDGTMPPAQDELERVADHLIEHYRPGASFTAEELFWVWYGRPPSERVQPEVDLFEDAVRTSPRFEVHPRRLFEFRPVEPENAARAEPDFEEVGALSARIDAALPRDARLLRKSYPPGVPHMTLVFAFPDVVGEVRMSMLQSLFEGTGWTFEIHPEPNIAAVEGEVQRLLPEPRLVVGSPSVRIAERRVTLALARALFPEEELEWVECRRAARERTGFDLEWKVKVSTPTAKVQHDSEGRLEINLAYQTLRSVFATEAHAPCRIGRKPGGPSEEPYIELAFISPEVGERYRGRIEELERRLGWRLRLASTPNQNAILEEARAVLRGLKVRKGPSFHPREREVKAQLEGHPDPSERERLIRELEQKTGYRLELS